MNSLHDRFLVRTQTPSADVAGTLSRLSTALDRLRAAYLNLLAEKKAERNGTSFDVERECLDDGAVLAAIEEGGTSREAA